MPSSIPRERIGRRPRVAGARSMLASTRDWLDSLLMVVSSRNSDNGRIVAPPSPTFGPIEEKWSRDGKSHKVLCSKEDAIMGYVLRQTISRSQETSKAATPHRT